jgi:ferrous-iron efflux pump FieF
MTRPSPHKPLGRRSLRRLASEVGLGVAALLILLELWAWAASDSISLLSALVDAMVDFLAAAFTFLGVRYAERPPDLSHRFGHGKGESIAALLQAALLAGAALVLIFEAVQRLVSPHPVAALGLGMLVMLAASALALGLYLFQTHVVRRTRSEAVEADRIHRRSDIMLFMAVLAALFLTDLTGWSDFDPLFALPIAGFMGWSSLGIARRAAATLLDRELSDAERHRIERIVRAHVSGPALHDLRSRSGGDRLFIEFHLELPAEMSLGAAHRITDEIEWDLASAFPKAEIIIHQEPAGIRDARRDHRLH